MPDACFFVAQLDVRVSCEQDGGADHQRQPFGQGHGSRRAPDTGEGAYPAAGGREEMRSNGGGRGRGGDSLTVLYELADTATIETTTRRRTRGIKRLFVCLMSHDIGGMIRV